MKLLFVILAIIIALQFRNKTIHSFKEETLDLSTYFFSDLKNMNQYKRKIWIHLPNDYKKLENFGSSIYSPLNYQLLCIKSVIERCNTSYDIILFNDEDMNALLPNEKNIQFEKISGDLLDNYRNISFLKILYLYGGVFLPPCFFMKDNFDKVDINNDFFIGEFVNQGKNVSMNKFINSIEIMGSNKQNKTLFEYINHYSKDFTQNIRFSELIKDIPVINGQMIGTKDNENNPLYLEDLMENKKIQLHSSHIGIYIPQCELKKRTKYNWFIHLSLRDLLETNIFISNYMKQWI